MKLARVTAAAAMLHVGAAAAETEYTPFAGTGAAFLRVEPSARAAAMADALGAGAQDPWAIGWNPACLSRLGGPELSAAHVEWRNGYRGEAFAGAMPFRAGFAGLAIELLSGAGTAEFDADGASTGALYPTGHVSVALGYSRSKGALRFGAAIRAVRGSVADSARTGVTVDAGILWPPSDLLRRRAAHGAAPEPAPDIPPAPALMLAAAFRNVGLPAEGRAPAELALAASWHRRFDRAGELHANAELAVFREWTGEMRIGAEHGVPLRGVRLWPRLGYRLGAASAGPESTGPTFGLGIEYGWARLDYAAVPYELLGVTHRVSLNVWPGRRPVSPAAPRAEPTPTSSPTPEPQPPPATPEPSPAPATAEPTPAPPPPAAAAPARMDVKVRSTLDDAGNTVVSAALSVRTEGTEQFRRWTIRIEGAGARDVKTWTGGEVPPPASIVFTPGKAGLPVADRPFARWSVEDRQGTVREGAVPLVPLLSFAEHEGFGRTPLVATSLLRTSVGGALLLRTEPVADVRVERWSVVVRDARGAVLQRTEGKGGPPRDLALGRAGASPAGAPPAAGARISLTVRDRFASEERTEGPLSTARPDCAERTLRLLRFGVGRFALEPYMLVQLSRAAAMIAADPSARVRVTGFTDDGGRGTPGGRRRNDKLSLDRARAVREHLVRREAVSADRLEVLGRAWEDPVSPNATAAGRAENRRVEITVTTCPPRSPGSLPAPASGGSAVPVPVQP